MPHLATLARLLAVIVPMAARFAQHRRRIRHLTQPVEHAGVADRIGRPQRQAEHRPQVVLKLRGLRAFDGPMAGVVHPRRHLVGHQLAAATEQFEREHAHVIKRFRQPSRVAGGLVHQRGIHRRCRRQAGRQHAVHVPVPGQRPGAELAIAAAHSHHAQLALERNKRFQNQAHLLRLCAQRLPGSCGVLRLVDTELALAVIAQTAGLEDAGRADAANRRLQPFPRLHILECRHRDIQFPEQGLL